MITLHHLNNSRSQRILWLLEELRVPYEIKRYQRDATTLLAPPELRARPSACATPTGCTLLKARPCRRCCSS